MLANTPGDEKPYAVFDDKIVDQLFTQCRIAKAEAKKAGSDANATLALCTLLEDALKSYRKIRDEYYDRLEIERERDEAEDRLNEVTSEIQKSQSSS